MIDHPEAFGDEEDEDEDEREFAEEIEKRYFRWRDEIRRQLAR